MSVSEIPHTSSGRQVKTVMIIELKYVRFNFYFLSGLYVFLGLIAKIPRRLLESAEYARDGK